MSCESHETAGEKLASLVRFAADEVQLIFDERDGLVRSWFIAGATVF
jgi:hypothetical protein